MASMSSKDAPGGQLPSSADDIPGRAKYTSTAVLEAGSSVMQSFAPINQISSHVCTWALYSQDLGRKIQTHHHCARLNEDFMQCVVYDNDQANARVIGVEYIVSDKLFANLPEEEKKLWHSHYYEIKTGLWMNPGVPETVQQQELKALAKTYGKFWLTWQFDRGDRLPLGPPSLMVSPQAEEAGQIPAHMIAARDEQYGISTAEKAESRKNSIVEPEGGIDPLADHWKSGKGWTTRIEEVDMKLTGETPLSTAGATASGLKEE
eukprot:SM000014S00245  [mRNA]  locus=s14:238560:240103:+ [translate_table: standard]